ncbi:butyrophilin subfamily 3 member A1-like [Heterodontus francisci]|uniref:butyrophilin subfamily 3 member A1-like n=1 Tax=Heterodontus francisci TaxID=7792 RepID=UPI00355B46CF
MDRLRCFAMFGRMGLWALCLIFLRIQSTLADVFRVTGPEAPVVGMVGGVAVLECQLIPEKPPAGMELQWARSASKLHTTIHLYRFGDDVEQQQAEAYMGRTEFFKDEFKQGNMSLRLKDVRLEDEGDYLCMVEHGKIIEQALIKLKVASFGLRPAIRLDGYRKNGIGLQCNSSSWYPSPMMHWADENGVNMTEKAQTRTVRSADGLYSILSAIEVTSDYTNTFHCSVKSSTLKHSQEVNLHIPDEFFPRMSRYFTAFIVFFLLLVAILTTAGYFQFKKWKIMKELHKRPTIAEFLSSTNHQAQLSRDIDNAEANLNREETLSKTAAERVISHAAPVTFDPETVNPYLATSEDCLTLSFNEEWQDLPPNPKRFNSRLFAMAAEGYKGGSQYWEVLVGNKPDWDLGVVKETIARDDWITLSPENGYWTIGKRGDCYETNDTTPEPIKGKATAQKIGIHLHYEDGTVRFYNADDMTPIYTFTAKFTEKIYPFFSPWGSQEKMSISPLSPSPLSDHCSQ